MKKAKIGTSDGLDKLSFHSFFSDSVNYKDLLTTVDLTVDIFTGDEYGFVVSEEREESGMSGK